MKPGDTLIETYTPALNRWRLWGDGAEHCKLLSTWILEGATLPIGRFFHVKNERYFLQSLDSFYETESEALCAYIAGEEINLQQTREQITLLEGEIPKIQDRILSAQNRINELNKQ